MHLLINRIVYYNMKNINRRNGEKVGLKMELIVKILTGLVITLVFLKYPKLQKKFQEIALDMGAILVALGLIRIIVEVLIAILEAILKR